MSGSADKSIKIWNLIKRTEEYTFTGHTSYVKSVCVSPCGKFIVSGSNDKSVKIWNLLEHREECTLTGHTNAVSSVCVSPNGKFIVSGSEDNLIKIWNFFERREQCTYTGHMSSVLSVCVSPDGKFIMSGSQDASIKIWKCLERREESTFKGHSLGVASLCASPDGKYFVSGSNDNSIKIWNFLENREECTFIGHTRNVMSVCISPDSKFIVSGSFDNSIKIWNLLLRREEYTFIGHTSPVKSVCVSPDGKFIVSGSWDNSIKIWNFIERREECTFTGHMAYVNSVCVSPNSKFIVSGSSDSSIKIWNFLERREEFTFTGHTMTVTSVFFSPDGNFIVSGSEDYSVRIWNFLELREECTLTGHTNIVNSVCMSPDGKFIVSGSNDKSIKIWNLLERREECTFTGHTEDIFSVCCSPDGRLILSGSNDYSVKIWNLSERRKASISRGHTKFMSNECVSPDGKFIVSGSEENSIKVWNLLKRREECTFTGHMSAVKSVYVSPNGNFIVSVSCDYSIKIWSFLERREEHTFADLKSSINSIIFTTDSKLIIIPDHNCIKIWNTQIRSEYLILANSKYSLTSIELSADEAFIIGNFHDLSMKIWNTQTRKEQKLERYHPTFLKSLSASSSKVTQYYKTTDSKFAFKESNGILDLIEINQIENSAKAVHENPSSYGRTSIERSLISEAFRTNGSSKTASSILHTQLDICNFTMAHFACFTGNMAFLKRITEDLNFVLRIDAFGKSPLFYAIVKKRQDEIDFLLEKLANLFDLAHYANFEQSMFAIRNDFPLIVSNSSRQLHHVVNKLMACSSVIYTTLDEELPIYRYGFSSTPKIEDYSTTDSKANGEEMPVIFQRSYFPISCSSGDLKNIDLLDAIANCKNAQVIRAPIIRYFVQIQWDALKSWVICFTGLLFLNIVLLMVLIGLNNFEWYLVVPFLTVNVLLMVWEMIQMVMNRKEYFEDPWNYLDISRFTFTIVWVTVELYGLASLHFRWAVALLNLLRGLTGFRLFDGTRFYIELILRSLNDIKYFFVMFSYSTLTFGFLFMISRQETLSFNNIWAENYDLNFGNYHDSERGSHFMNYIVYFGATVINVVLMLNLLISILGDSYERFQLDQVNIDIKEKAQNSRELQLMFFWANRLTDAMYMRICVNAFEDEEDQDWEGRMRFMDKRLEKLSPQIKNLDEKTTATNKSIEAKIDTKIASLENNIRSLDGKIETNIKSLDGKIEANNEKLEAILKILSNK